jgi:hypothetical protein
MWGGGEIKYCVGGGGGMSYGGKGKSGSADLIYEDFIPCNLKHNCPINSVVSVNESVN